MYDMMSHDGLLYLTGFGGIYAYDGATLRNVTSAANYGESLALHEGRIYMLSRAAAAGFSRVAYRHPVTGAVVTSLQYLKFT